MNNITIERMIFTNVATKAQTFGYRMFDNEGTQVFDNTMSATDMTDHPTLFLHTAQDRFTFVEQDMLEAAKQDYNRITIDGVDYEFTIDGDDWILTEI
jgi:hypothetical protein